MWLHQMHKSFREFNMLVHERTEALLLGEPSQSELERRETSRQSEFRRLANESHRSNKCVSIYMHYLDVWQRRVRRVLDMGLEDFVVRELKRSRSAQPINRVEKMTLKHLYKSKFLQKMNRMHASLSNNLVLKVRKEITDYVENVEGLGFIFRRVPSIDL